MKASEPTIYSHTALRGIAALYVVFFHVYGNDRVDWDNKSSFSQFFQWGPYAVDLFFVLSGFILNWVYLSHTAQLDWRSFFRARAARILPLYYLTLLTTLPVPIYSLIRHGVKYVGQSYPVDLVLNVFLVSGIVDGGHRTINRPAWSISVEVFCYVAIFPLLVFTARCCKRRKIGLALAGGIAVILTCLLSSCHGWNSLPIFHGSWDCSFLSRGVFGFSVGFLLCSLFRDPATWKPGGGAVNFVVGGAMLLFLLVRYKFLPESVIIYVIPLVVYFTAADTGLAARLLKMKPLQWLGERSYSIYLWHHLLQDWTGFLAFSAHIPMSIYNVLVILLILVAGDLSYTFFERPARNYIKGFGLRKSPTLRFS